MHPQHWSLWVNLKHNLWRLPIPNILYFTLGVRAVLLEVFNVKFSYLPPFSPLYCTLSHIVNPLREPNMNVFNRRGQKNS